MKIDGGDLLGRTIRIHRKRAGITQAELATLAGIGKTAVFDAEKGKETIKLCTLLSILRVLNIGVEVHSPILDEVAHDDSQG